ncbi:Cytosolic iron-sulfur protein assembly protein [Coemansia sp. Benny D115]|nr:Cytosolic iron-sulfur protein assembly protein [Coemansia sp. Benny D115]
MATHLRLAAELTGHEDRVWQLSWDPSGTKLASCSGDKSVRIWAPLQNSQFFTTNDRQSSGTMEVDQQPIGSSWSCLEAVDNAHKRTIRSVAFEPTRGRGLATASFDGTTAIWEEEDGVSGQHECVATLEGHENEAKCVAWSPSGQLVATCGRDKSVWIWESNGEGDFDCISVLMEHTQDVKMVLWHPVEDILVSFSYDDTIKVWREEDDDWYAAKTIKGHTSTVWGGAFSPDGRYLASVSDDRSVRVWMQEGGGCFGRSDQEITCVAQVPESVHSRAIYSVSWDRASSSEQNAQDSEGLGYLATGCGDNRVRVFRVSRRNDGSAMLNVDMLCEQLNAHGLSDINCVKWNPKYPGWLATCGDDNTVRVWHLEHTK